MAAGSQSTDQLLQDIRSLVSASSFCYQDFDFKCQGSVFSAYQCVQTTSGGAVSAHTFGNSPGLNNHYGTFRCDDNSGTYVDSGSFGPSVLPVVKWLPGDIGDAGDISDAFDSSDR